MNRTLHQYASHGITLGSHELLDESQINEILALLRRSHHEAAQTLEGRGSTFFASTVVWGEVVVKQYRRGGVLRRLIGTRYLRWGMIRSQSEYRLLGLVRSLGVPAPEPLAYGHRGVLVYENWLITRRILGAESLAYVGFQDPERAVELAQKLKDPLEILIKNKVWHVDLHPGNVLVDQDDQLVFLDFDKARIFRGSERELRARYLRRWRRAVLKHDLPESLSEVICLQLKGGRCSK